MGVIINGVILWQAQSEVEELGVGADEYETLLTLVRIYYGIGALIGVIFLVCAGLIFQFPLICSYTALVTFILAGIIALLLNPFRLFSIGGWVVRMAIFGGLVQAVNNAHYYKSVRSA